MARRMAIPMRLTEVPSGLAGGMQVGQMALEKYKFDTEVALRRTALQQQREQAEAEQKFREQALKAEIEEHQRAEKAKREIAAEKKRVEAERRKAVAGTGTGRVPPVTPVVPTTPVALPTAPPAQPPHMPGPPPGQMPAPQGMPSLGAWPQIQQAPQPAGPPDELDIMGPGFAPRVPTDPLSLASPAARARYAARVGTLAREADVAERHAQTLEDRRERLRELLATGKLEHESTFHTADAAANAARTAAELARSKHVKEQETALAELQQEQETEAKQAGIAEQLNDADGPKELERLAQKLSQDNPDERDFIKDIADAKKKAIDDEQKREAAALKPEIHKHFQRRVNNFRYHTKKAEPNSPVHVEEHGRAYEKLSDEYMNILTAYPDNPAVQEMADKKYRWAVTQLGTVPEFKHDLSQDAIDTWNMAIREVVGDETGLVTTQRQTIAVLARLRLALREGLITRRDFTYIQSLYQSWLMERIKQAAREGALDGILDVLERQNEAE